MAGFSFSDMPKINVNRSIFKRSFSHKTTINTGDLVPIYWDNVLPGDTVQMKVSQLVRSLTVSAPVMDNAFITLAGFFVPYLAIWTSTKEFFGEGMQFGASLPSKRIPSINPNKYGAYHEAGDCFPAGSLGNYLGLPCVKYTFTGQDDPKWQAFCRSISELPFRAYYSIYNQYWLDENYDIPYDNDLGDSPNDRHFWTENCGKASKFHDYFTSVLPEPQKGDPVTFGVTGIAPVEPSQAALKAAISIAEPKVNVSITDQANAMSPLTSPNIFAYGDGGSGYSPVRLHWQGSEGNENNVPVEKITGSYDSTIEYMGDQQFGYADLVNASLITVNDFRFAVQLQRFLEKNARYGTRYSEFIYGHFGVHDPALEEQIPKALWKVTLPLSMETVVANSSGGDNILGDMAGYSKTGNTTDNYVNSFTQYGIYMIVAVIRTYQTYSGGIPRKFTRLGLLDQYFPVFDHLGEQPVYTYEISLPACLNNVSGVSDTSTLDDISPIFGFQEAFADFRYSPNMVSGLLAPDAVGSLDMWTYSIKVDDIPATCNYQFLFQSKSEVERTLAYNDTFQWLADFYFDTKWSRPMLVHSIPGLVDHD